MTRILTPQELLSARKQLGINAGLGRPLSIYEMARACGLADGARHVRYLEKGERDPSGPLCKLILYMLKFGTDAA